MEAAHYKLGTIEMDNRDNSASHIKRTKSNTVFCVVVSYSVSYLFLLLSCNN